MLWTRVCITIDPVGHVPCANIAAHVVNGFHDDPAGRSGGVITFSL